MKVLAPVSLVLVAVMAIVSTMLWRELRTDRELIAELRTQLTEAKTALAARPVAQPAPAALPQAPVELATVAIAPAAPPAKPTLEQAAMATVATYAKRQKTLLDDPEYRKARLAQAHVDLKTRYAGLGVELGLSEKELDALFDLVAEQQVRMEAEMSGRMANGTAPDAALQADLLRLRDEQKKAVVAMIGPARFEQFEEYGQTQPSRTRVNNLTALLARSGRPLTAGQTRSLTAVIIAEQKLRESDAKALRDAGKPLPSQPDLEAETNRRILENSATFLDGQQLELLKGRFRQRDQIDRANDRVEQREREVLQEPKN